MFDALDILLSVCSGRDDFYMSVAAAVVRLEPKVMLKRWSLMQVRIKLKINLLHVSDSVYSM